MPENDLKQIRLNPDNLQSKEDMADTMSKLMKLPEYFGGNLDALADVLSEVSSETVFEVDISDIDRFAGGYPKKVLSVIAHSCEENPHLHLYLTDKG